MVVNRVHKYMPRRVFTGKVSTVSLRLLNETARKRSFGGWRGQEEVMGKQYSEPFGCCSFLCEAVQRAVSGTPLRLLSHPAFTCDPQPRPSPLVRSFVHPTSLLFFPNFAFSIFSLSKMGNYIPQPYSPISPSYSGKKYCFLKCHLCRLFFK